MKIAVIGSGNVGGTLGKGWAKKEHDVAFGVRNTSDPKLKELLAATAGKARAGSVRDARLAPTLLLSPFHGTLHRML